MATLTFTYLGKCAGDHIDLRLNVNGTARMNMTVTGTDIKTASADTDMAEQFCFILLKSFCRKWYRDNPTGTLGQLRTALEAQEWVF